METRNANFKTPERQGVISSLPQTAVKARPIGRAVADALTGLGGDTSAQLSDPGAIEYASWLRLLRRSTP